MTEGIVTCPTCCTRIDTYDRCPAERGLGRCMESAGHDGWHWSQVSSPGIMRWTGLHAEHGMCSSRISLTEWCNKKAGHDGAHKITNGPGVAFVLPSDSSQGAAQHRPVCPRPK